MNHSWFGGDAPSQPLSVDIIQNLRGFQSRQALRVASMAIAASLPTNVDEARKFYNEAPSTCSARERSENNQYWKVNLGLGFGVFSYCFFIYLFLLCDKRKITMHTYCFFTTKCIG